MFLERNSLLFTFATMLVLGIVAPSYAEEIKLEYAFGSYETRLQDGLETNWQPVSEISQVPVWNGEDPSKKMLWLKLRLPENFPENAVITFGRARYHLEVLHHGGLVYQFGEMRKSEPTPFLGLPFHYMPLSPAMAGGELIIKVLSDGYRIGVSGPIEIETSQGVFRGFLQRDLIYVTLACFFFAFGTILLVVGGLSRKNSGLSLIFLFWSIAVFTVSRIDLKIILGFLSPRHWEFVQITAALGAMLFFHRFWLSFSQRFRYWHNGMTIFILFLPFAYMGFDVIGVFPLSKSFYLVASLIVATNTVSLILISMDYKRKSLPGIFAFGFQLNILAGWIDILSFQNLVVIKTPLLPWGVLVFALMLSSLYYQRILYQFRDKVRLEKDLETAAVFQQQINNLTQIESEGLQLRLATFPADYIAGDWIDFQIIADRYLYIHLADVTGHGPLAAIAATYAKGLLKAAQKPEEMLKLTPEEYLSQVHHFLNSMLRSAGSEHYPMSMSVLSVVFDKKTGIMTFTNSGHMPPLILAAESGRGRFLSARNHSLLGLQDSENFSVTTENLELKTGELLLLYSDGLIDLVRKRDRETFQSALLKAIRLIEPMTSENIDGFFRERYRQAKSHATIADDITYICMSRDAGEHEVEETG